MKFKRLVSIFAGITLLSASASVSAAKFSDLSGHWAEEYVNAMVSEGYIKGYDDGTFKPDKTITKTEALILLSRMLGVESSDYSETVDNAMEVYSNSLDKYSTAYKKEISYLLYRGVIDSNDLDDYISSTNKNSSLLRHQCAVLLTKLLGAEEEVKDSVFISSSYSDTAQIPAEARPYVEYVRDAKIMEGMGVDSYGDPIFGPLESVTRGQMAKMLSSLIDVLDINIENGVITKLDAFNDSVFVDEEEYELEKDTLIKLNGEDADFDELSEGMSVLVIVSKNKVSMVEAFSVKSDEPIRGVVVSATSGADGNKIVVSDPEDSTKRTTYNASSNVKVVIGKITDSFGKINTNDYVEMIVENGIATRIEVVDKNKTITATLSSKDINSKNPSITVSDVNGIKTTYDCSSDGVSVTRNGFSSNLSELVAGDSVVLKLVYNKVTKISAESTTSSYSGNIVSITHTKNGSSLIININGKEAEYSLGSSTKITIDGAESSVYDLRPGSAIDFKAESSLITKLETTKTASKNVIEGKVVMVQEKYDLIFVDDGNGEITVGVKSTTNIARSSNGSTLKLSGIKAGDEVTITGSNSTGMFVATTIVVH